MATTVPESQDIYFVKSERYPDWFTSRKVNPHTVFSKESALRKERGFELEPHLLNVAGIKTSVFDLEQKNGNVSGFILSLDEQVQQDYCRRWIEALVNNKDYLARCLCELEAFTYERAGFEMKPTLHNFQVMTQTFSWAYAFSIEQERRANNLRRNHQAPVYRTPEQIAHFLRTELDINVLQHNLSTGSAIFTGFNKKNHALFTGPGLIIDYWKTIKTAHPSVEGFKHHAYFFPEVWMRKNAHPIITIEDDRPSSLPVLPPPESTL